MVPYILGEGCARAFILCTEALFVSVVSGLGLTTGAAGVTGGGAGGTGGTDVGFVHYARGAAFARNRTFGFIPTVAVSVVISSGRG